MTDKTPVDTLDPQQSVSIWRERLNELIGVVKKPTVKHYTSSVTLGDDVDIAAGDAASGPITLTLPAAPGDGDTFEIFKIDVTGNAVTIARNGNTINLAAADATITVPATFRRLTWTSSVGTWFMR